MERWEDLLKNARPATALPDEEIAGNNQPLTTGFGELVQQRIAQIGELEQVADEKAASEAKRRSALALVATRNAAFEGTPPVEIWGSVGATACQEFLSYMDSKEHTPAVELPLVTEATGLFGRGPRRVKHSIDAYRIGALTAAHSGYEYPPKDKTEMFLCGDGSVRLYNGAAQPEHHMTTALPIGLDSKPIPPSVGFYESAVTVFEQDVRSMYRFVDTHKFHSQTIPECLADIAAQFELTGNPRDEHTFWDLPPAR